MSHAKSVQAIRDDSPDLEARIITAIGRAGPRNVAQISRMTGAHQETIRYKIKKRFGRLGFRFHAEVDYAKLGLTLHWATLDFAQPYDSMATQILTALNQVGYLVYYAKLVPQGNFIALFALPTGTSEQYKEFLAGLKVEGILDGFSLNRDTANRNKPMDPRFFNFRSGRWEIEWNKVPGLPPNPLPSGGRAEPQDFDAYDLLIIKELQKDSLQHLTGIARKLRVHQKTLEYHYRTHVQKWKLIPSYRIRWAQDLSKRLTHSTATTLFTFRDLTKAELAAAQAAMSKVPFLWSEDLLEDGTYIAFMYVPLTDLMAVSTYVERAAPRLGSRLEIGFVKPAESYAFTIPHHMYQGGLWKFNPRQMARALQRESNAPIKK
ncbi:MAG: Lrp/AsnC family transcriptional regulator [Nitrososphaerota archaeon]|nr:Lrp/AsnC family transcriptional regulator [Nitrososphaerota archaeon]